VPDLKNGPGHYPTTPLPGQPGNAAIAGHRTTYGAPFNRLDELDVGDEVVTTTQQGEFHYEVTEEIVVRPYQTEVLDPTEDAMLTLTTCNPKYSARERLVIKAKLVDEPASAPTERPEPEPERPDVDPAGLSGERVGRGPAILWGAIAALVALVVWLLARRRRTGVKWAIYAAGAPVFLVVLYVFFENFSRLLPANF
jgi:sortase A